jgi:hypothetical protein
MWPVRLRKILKYLSLKPTVAVEVDYELRWLKYHTNVKTHGPDSGSAELWMSWTELNQFFIVSTSHNFRSGHRSPEFRLVQAITYFFFTGSCTGITSYSPLISIFFFVKLIFIFIVLLQSIQEGIEVKIDF